MSRQVRFWSFVTLLVAGVSMGLATLVAQDKPAEPREERRVFTLDGRGSQLGVTVRDLPAAGGVRIDDVDTDGPAARAGVQPGDVIVEFDGERVRSARQLTRLVRETPDGRAVEIALMRGGTRQTVTATPEVRSFAWNMDIDGDRIRRDVERSLEGLRGFRMEPPVMDFRFDNGGGTMTWTRREGRAGVTLEPLSDQLAAYFGAAGGGALVSAVTSGSAAEKAGLEAGDVITSVNGERVDNARDAARAIRRAGDAEMTLEIVRNKQPATVKMSLGSPGRN